ncbi:MAG: hypothetical protein ACYC7H_07475, partial [Chloroflexota bacterium]
MQATISKRKPGIVDTLGAGFENINRRPWLVLVPILVDLLLWRGPLVTPLPLAQRLLNWYESALGAGANLVAPNGQRFEELRQTAEAAVAGFNMLSLLVLNFIANVPTTTSGHQADTPIVIPVSSEVAFVLLVITLQLLGVLLGCVYFGLIAQQVRDGTVRPLLLLAKLRSYFLSVVVLGLMLLGVLVALGVPLSLLVTFAVMAGGPVGSGLAAALLAGLYVAGMWALLFLFFTLDAIVVSEVRALRAILNSVSIVGKNFWSALAFVALTVLILTGTQIIWSNLSDSTLGTVAGILGNAYIASGLAAASMLFYQSRLAGLEHHGNDK